MNANVAYISHTQADLAPCMLNMTASVCQDLLRGMRYAYELGFYSLREKQDDVSKRLENEITKLSRQGESTQYMIIGICIGLIAISVGAAIPIFMWVIKDKSNALAIFADIRQEEARKIIEDSRQLDIKNLHYKRKWIQGAGESNESFWHKITTEHRRGFGRDQSDLDFVPRPRSKDKKKHQHNDNEKTIQEIKEEVPEEEEDEEKRCELEEAERKLELEEEEKKRKRHEKLSEIDYPLRRKFIVRVLGVFLLFFGYSGFALYFNNYVHNKNAEASELLFALCKRTLYVFNMNFLLVEGMLTNSTLMVGNNPYADGKLYMMDIVDEMLRIDALVKDFQKSGSRLIYGDYLDLMDQAEGPAFCNVSDVYSDIPISIYTTCWGIYSGPINNGLSAGLAYYMNQHITAAQDFLSMNMSAPNATITISTVSTALMNLGPPLTFALSFVLHGTMTVFYDCANRFFDTVGTIVYSTSSVFVGIFVVIYVLIFSRFIVTLNEEIWHTHEMVNMIPKDILEKNIVVRELVWKRRL
ncbi:MAG: hypothetical protein P4M11_09325 [Candidatus Pacebacteria bacterium]|nr:hypothetical protein [Candidatus Paceibacterota bacterium]